MAERILLVDDDALLLESLGFSLKRCGYEVSAAASCREALEAVRRQPPDLAILDIGLPDGDGLRLCQSLQIDRPVPVIFLTAHDREMDVILGLEHGADDYVTKPFATGELTARVGAVLRRTRGPHDRPPDRFEVGPVSLDIARHEVTVSGGVVELAPKEFDLLCLLMRRPGKVSSRQELVDALWGKGYFGDTRVLDVHVRWLREAIERDPDRPCLVQTVRGVGYKFASK
jgi:DNA-binding response OmpR family regulator